MCIPWRRDASRHLLSHAGATAFAAPAESTLDFCGDQERAEIFRQSVAHGADWGKTSDDRLCPVSRGWLAPLWGPLGGRAIGGPRSLHERTQRRNVSRHAIDHRRRNSVQGCGTSFAAPATTQSSLRETCSAKVFDQAEVLSRADHPNPCLSEPRSRPIRSCGAGWLGNPTRISPTWSDSARWRSPRPSPPAVCRPGLLFWVGPDASGGCAKSAWPGRVQLDLPLGATGSRFARGVGREASEKRPHPPTVRFVFPSPARI